MAKTPLTVGASGDAVERLQSFLAAQGYEIPPSESTRQFFGPATRQALLQFQKKNGLPTSGAVDDKTASKIGAASPRPQPSGVSSNGPAGKPAPASGGADGSAIWPKPPISPGQFQPRPARPAKPSSAWPFTLAASPAVGDSRAFFALEEATLAGTVLDNLTNGSATAKAALSATLNTALKSSLTAGLDPVKYSALSGLVEKIGTVDIAANRNSTIQAFLKAQAAPMVAKDGAMKKAVDAEVAKIPGATTLGGLLQLDVPLQINPLFQADVTKVHIASFLATSPALGKDLQVQADFIERYVGNRSSSADFWKRLTVNQKLKPIIPELQVTMHLAAVTGRNTALMTAVRAQFHLATPADLTKLTASDWEKLLNTPVNGTLLAIPSSVKGETREQRVSNYASSISTQVRTAFATLYIGQEMAAQPQFDANLVKSVLASNPGLNPAKRLPASLTWSDLADPQAAKAAMAAFRKEIRAFPGLDHTTLLSGSSPSNPVRQHVSNLIANSSDFDIRTAKISPENLPALQQVPEALQAPVIEQLKSLQRLSRLTTEYSQIYALQSAGVHAASAVARIPQASFLNTYASALGGRAAAQIVYSKAQNIHAQMTNVFMRVNDALRGPHFRVFGDVAGGTQQVLQTIPDLATLFGDQSTCQCQECRAMDGPAAYFVDLMNYLANSHTNTTTTLTPAEVLQARRPDLWYLKLNCENTNTELPYIDLVNEILESYVVNGHLDWSTAKNTPADATTDQLTVSPEYTNSQAYSILNAQVYPGILPFDLPLETARVFLEALGTSRAKLMETFRHNNVPSELAVACEYLRISCETCVLTTANSQMLQDFLGIPIAFDYVNGRLMFSGSMTPAQKVFLLRLPGGTGYSQAITDLFQMGNPANTGSYAVRLAALPSSGLLMASPIPIQFSTANGGQFSFQGTMNWAQQSVLLGITLRRFVLSGAETTDTGYQAAYQAAINSLFQLSQHAASGCYSVNLSTPAPVSPLLSSIPISFTDTQATFTGTMTAGQQAILLNLSTDAVYTAAINQLFQMSSQAALGTFTCAWAKPPNISLPTQLIPITYSGQTLSIQSAMTPAQRVVLLSLSTDVNYQAAINNLFLMGSPSAGGSFTVPLGSLPENVALPDEFASQIAYDRFNGRLNFTGSPSVGQQKTAQYLNFKLPTPISPPASVILPNVPQAVADFLGIPVSYSNQALICRGSFTKPQASVLLDLSTDPAYRAAITNLLEAPPINGESSVPLASLPEGVVLPGNLATQIFQDPATNQWTATAGLSRAAQTALNTVSNTISNSDSGLISALNNLNTIVESSPVDELDILVNPTLRPTSQFYGVASGGNEVPSSAQAVEAFTAATGIVYLDLVALLETTFLNPSQSITLNVNTGPDTDQCDLSATCISSSNTTDLTTFFQRAYRFIRLWKKMGWAVTEVDLALSVLGQGDITPGVILQLAQIKRIQQTLNLAVDQVLSFWGDVNTAGRQSLYMRLFQNPAVVNPVDPAFILTYSAGSLQSLPQLSYTFPASGNSVAYSFQSSQVSNSGQLSFSGAFSPDEKSQISAVLQPGWVGPFAGSHPYTLPDSFAFPDSAVNTITCDPPITRTVQGPLQNTTEVSPGQFFFTGLMTDAEYAILKALSTTDSSYQLAIDNLYDLAFLTSVATTAPGNTTISAHQNTVLAALRISATDLAALLAGPTAVPDVLNLENLSALYRRATLAQSSGLAIVDLLTLITLTGIDPFESPDGALRFIELAQYVQNSNFSIQQLKYIYANTSSPTAGVAPLLADLFQVLASLQAGLRQIVQTDAFQPDPKGARLKQALASILPANLVSQAVGLVNGTQVYSTPYAESALPANVVTYLYPVPLPLTYSSVDSQGNPEPGQLVLACNPTPQQWAVLQSVSSDPFYLSALTDLFRMVSAAAANSGTYSTLAALPAPLQSSSLSNPIVILYAAAQLTFSGSSATPNTPMTADQQQVLLGMSTDASFKTAINLLFTNSQANGGPVSVLLPSLNLPQGTSLTSNPILISWAAGQLTFSGSSTAPNTAMTPAQQAVLLGISADSAFQAAVNLLFTNSQPTSGSAPVSIPVSVPLASLPAEVSLSANPIVVSYGGQLTFSGSLTAPNTAMTTGQQAVLLGISTDSAFQAAINALFTNSQANGGPVSVLLSSLTLSNPILISYADGQLTFSGSSTAPNTPMTASQQAVLLGMSTDASFQAAINALSRQSQVPASVPLPSLNLPQGTSLSSNPILISYANGQLSFSGSSTAPNTAMTTAQQSVLLGMSTDSVFRSAINTLFTNSQGKVGPFSVPLPSLNLSIGVAPPANLIPITYATSVGQLTFIDPTTGLTGMTGAQKSVLLGLSQDPGWQAAVSNLYAMSTNTPPYSTPLSSLPASLALPGDLPLVLLSPPASQSTTSTSLLQFVGPMTSAAQSTLLLLDPGDATFMAAVGNLYAQPQSFIAQTLVPALNGFLTVTDAVTNLIETPSSTTQQKGEFLLRSALADLQQTASYNLILQTLGAALALDVPTLSWLLQQVLPGFIAGSAGFSASYYASQNQAGMAVVTRTDAVINFQWGLQAPGSSIIPGISGPPFSADWKASVVVPSTDSFTFYVQADSQSTVQLFVNGTQCVLSTSPRTSSIDYTGSPIPLTQLDTCTIELKYSYSGPGLAPPVPAQVVLTWSSPVMPETLVIPEDNTMMDDFMALAAAGFSGAYYSFQNQAGTIALERTDAAVNFQWGSQTPDSSIPGPAFSADWKGSLVAPVTDSYTFDVQSDPASTVYLLVNGAQVLNPPAAASPSSYVSSPIPLSQAQVSTIELQYSGPGASSSATAAPPQVSLNWSSPAMAENLIGPPISVAVQDLQLLYRIASLLTTLSTKVGDVQYLQQNGTEFAGKDPNGGPATVPFDLTTLPPQASAYTSPWFDQWKRLNDLFALKATLPGSNVNIFKIFATASQEVDFYKTLSPVIVGATGWNGDQLQYLYAEFGFSPSDFVNEQPLVLLQKCLALSSQVGISCVKLFEWATTPPDPAQAQDIRNAVKAQYDATAWTTVGTPLADKLRNKQRDALVACTLTLPTIQAANVTDANGLYEYFLIDVQMEPCMLTSRIVQASAAVQLFVQRCLMNLEESAVAPSQIDANWWQWMQNYRVWQANREVFLYPENYIQPSLRDDMTPPFEDLMSALLQNPVTDDNATQAYGNYLNALNDVSQLEIVGTYWQQDQINEQAVGATTGADNNNTGFVNALHVFGRTAGSPRQYYYRQLSSTVNPAVDNAGLFPATWTPWEPVNANISGDHLTPVVWNGRLFLFWPTFNESTDPNAQAVTTAGSASPAPTIKQLQISMNWSEYKQGAWAGSQTTPSTVSVIPLGLNAYPAGLFSNWSLFAFDSGLTTNSGPTQSGSAILRIDYTNAGTLQNVLHDATFATAAWEDQHSEPVTTWQGQGNYDTKYYQGPGVGYGYNSSCCVTVTSGYGNETAAWGGVVSPLVPASPLQVWQGSAYAANGSPPFPNEGVEKNVGQAGIVRVSFYDIKQKDLGASVGEYFLFPSAPSGEYSLGTNVVIAPPQTAFVALQLLVYVPSEVPPVDITFSCACLTQITVLGQFTFSGFPGQVSSEGSPSFSPPVGSNLPSTPLGTSFNYMNLVGQGQLSLYFGPVLEYTSSYTPSYRLMFPQQGLFSNAPFTCGYMESSYELLPFFYSDQLRTYFAFATCYPSGFLVDSVLETFQTYWHPFACAFLQTFNWGGPAALLTLANQTRNNDGGVLSGLQLSFDGQGNPVLSPGLLVAQGQVFGYPETPSTGGPATLAPPLFSDGNLYFTSVVTPHFYWALTPQNLGDAWIGRYIPPNANPTGSSVFESTYVPNTQTVGQPYPLENVDFDSSGAYSSYNWELFFHIPLLVATQLSTNQQFDDAMTWLEYIFNPTSNSTAPIPQRYWNVLPFAADTEPGRIQDLLQLLHTENRDPQQRAEYNALLCQIAASQNDPFNPFAIARLRPMAFMKKTVMAYLDNLIVWGDYLFSQNTRESINEATQVYVLADQILGPRRASIPPREVTQDLTFHDIQGHLDSTSNYWAQMENIFPFSSSSASGQTENPGGPFLPPGNFHFCIPANTQLLGYWDTLADRLYKIRHCQNIAGQTQQLALFAPPINPALLVEATALGIDLDSVIAGLSAPSPNYRFTFMLQKALDLCAEVRSLGGALLSALEKNDGEGLSLLRTAQETSLLQAVLTVKQSQVDEANANYAGLQAAQDVASYRQSYYQNLIAAGLSSFETGQVTALTASQVLKTASQVGKLLAGALSLIPDASSGAAGISSGVALISEGGSKISQGVSLGADAINMAADILSYVAAMCSISGQWDRRSQEWSYQAQSAGLEVAQIAQQIAAANFRIQIANADYQNQRLQVTNSQAIQNFLTSKYTNQQLYSWMISQISGAYFQCYQMAYGLAQRAELCFRFELGLTTSNYVQFGHWDSLHKGLLAGEGLYSDLKSMEIAYVDQNVREYEIAKSISLVLLDPIALIWLKEKGLCFISLPEALFDIDYPGHYMRRIKSLSLTIPCVAGPYTSINGTLTLVTNRIRWDSTAPSRPSAYAESPPDDPRFIYDLTATQSIATSSAQNDSGMFEVNFRDERYLPFEGRGAISDWQLELPLGCNAIDFETITDIILNLKYTSRKGGSGLNTAATGALLPPAPAQTGTPMVTAFGKQQNLARFFSLRHEFPTEWYKFLLPAASGSPQTMTVMLSRERFPYQYRGKKIQLNWIDVAFKFKAAYPPETKLNSAPLGDFNSSGGQLSAVLVTPGSSSGSGPVPLPSTPGILNGTPFGRWSSGPAGLGAWQFQIMANNLPPSLVDANNNLIPSVVEDIYIVCHYTAK